MKITRIESLIVENPWNPWFFVKVETDEGITGIGEGIGYHWAKAAEAYLEQNKQTLFLGHDPHDFEALVMKVRRMLGIDRGLGMVERSVLSAVEIACWDILGKHYGVPVYKLLGGACRDRIRVYANAWYRDVEVSDPAAWARKAAEVVEGGYDALKFDPFGNAYRELCAGQLKHAVAVTAAIREAVGDGVDLIVDAHARFHFEPALQFCRKIEDYGLKWVEAPLLGYLEAEQHRELSRQSPVPIGTDVAGIDDLVGALPFLKERAVAIIQPDVGYSCGLLEMKKIGAVAEATGVFLAPHQSLGPVVSAATVQVAATIPSFLIMERFEDFGYPDWVPEMVKPIPKVENGYLPLPETPGLGLEFDFEEAARHPLEGKRIINLLSENWENRSLGR